MKKILLSLSALLLSVGLIAQTTVDIPWNQYGSGSPIADYQGKEVAKLASFTPTVGDIVSVTIKGTSNENITDFQLVLINDDAANEYWKELSDFVGLGNITAGEQFDFTKEFVIKATDTPVKLVFDGKNATLAGADGSGTSITLTLSDFEVSWFSPIAGALVLTETAEGTKQIIKNDILSVETAVTTENTVRVTLQGVSDVAANDFQVAIVDGTAAANYWTELSAYIDFSPSEVAAGETFTLTADIPITTAPVGTGAGSQNIVISAKSSAQRIQLSLTDFTAEILIGTSISKISEDINLIITSNEVSVDSQVASIIINSIQGNVVTYNSGSSVNISALAPGIYVATITKLSGEVVSYTFAK